MTDVKSDDEFEVGYSFDGPEAAEAPEEPEIEQQEGSEAEVQEEPEAEQEDQAVEQSAEESSSEAEETAEEQDWREKRISKLTHAKKRAEDKIREQEEELRKYRDKMGVKQDALPEIPAHPEPDLRYDNPAEYNRQLAEREKALVAHAIAAREKEIEQKTLAEKQRVHVASILEQYADRAKESKLSVDRLKYAEDVLVEAGISTDLGMYLYEHEHGPKLVNYLADRPSEVEKLISMSPLRAAEYIALNVVPKVGQVKPKTTAAPDPVKQRKGSGTPPKDDFALPEGYSLS